MQFLSGLPHIAAAGCGEQHDFFMRKIILLYKHVYHVRKAQYQIGNYSFDPFLLKQNLQYKQYIGDLHVQKQVD